MRIVVVEDNKMLADGIAHAFRDDGHGVDVIYSGRSALEFVLAESVDLLILDINLPEVSGLEILSGLRRGKSQMPVLLLTARDSTQDKIAGLDSGADDYLTKPFELSELKARARALLRRGGRGSLEVVTVGRVTLDSTARQILIDGQIQEIPRREFALAELLLLRHGHVISKQRIIDHLYGLDAEVEESTAELYVHRLRKRLRGAGVEIKTLRGLGYCLREPL